MLLLNQTAHGCMFKQSSTLLLRLQVSLKVWMKFWGAPTQKCKLHLHHEGFNKGVNGVKTSLSNRKREKIDDVTGARCDGLRACLSSL